MSSHTGSSSPSKSTFEFELLEGDAENVRTVAAPPNQFNPWIDPGALRITHRIGRGPFGDTWIATLHYAEGYDEPQEVAVKMLKFASEERVQPFMEKFQNVFYKCQEKKHVCWPYGLSLIREKICIVMKPYDRSVGDKMAQLKGDRLPLSDILRYCTDVAQGVLELHSEGIIVLNLKPCNLLLDERDQAVLGDFGIPMLLQGFTSSSSDLIFRLGTPNYMAPEQWEADVKGPVSCETDCWGFGCSIVEMFTGVRPWHGKSAEEIYAAVVIRHEKPKVPSEFPSAMENVLKGCFEYDFRNRPSFADILFALKKFQHVNGYNMASSTSSSFPLKESFEYELLDKDAENLKTVSASPIQSNPWIDPGVLKLTHRIGRGPFGDVWIATLHHFTDDSGDYSGNYREVAVKVLNFVSEEQIQPLMKRFESTFYKCQGTHVCQLYGISVKNGKICLVMKFYEASVGGKMTHLKGNQLALTDILRYGVDVAQGVMELHSQGVLVLNLKPFNFLCDEHDQAVAGDFGIPMLLQGIPLSNSDLTLRLGTPNYMAPEQWGPDTRGPVSYETDSWGFGCSIIEMFTGIMPWYAKSAEEIYMAVVVRREKPKIPSGLPCAVESIVRGCFEYDFRSRPSFADILFALKNPNATFGNSGWICAKDKLEVKGNDVQNCNWLFLKDKLQVGDYVRSRKVASLIKSGDTSTVEGTIVGMDSDMHMLVDINGLHDPLRIHASNLERFSLGFAAGDWVQLHKSSLQGSSSGNKLSPVGILHSVSCDGKVEVAFLGLGTLWTGNCSELQMADSFSVGQFVRIKVAISSPRFQWPRKENAWDTGRISWIFPNGCLLVKFPGRLFGNVPCLADPAEVEPVEFHTCVSMVEKFQHLKAVHWAVQPVIFTLGFLAVLKLGILMGSIGSKVVGRKIKQGGPKILDAQTAGQDPNNPGNARWHPPSVAKIFFKEGVTTAR